MTEAVTPTTGWGVLHLFCKVTPLGRRRRDRRGGEARAEGDHQVVTVAMLGHKADLAVMGVGPDLWRLRTPADRSAGGRPRRSSTRTSR